MTLANQLARLWATPLVTLSGEQWARPYEHWTVNRWAILSGSQFVKPSVKHLETL
jgi:hypothetical protein